MSTYKKLDIKIGGIPWQCVTTIREKGSEELNWLGSINRFKTNKQKENFIYN